MSKISSSIFAGFLRKKLLRLTLLGLLIGLISSFSIPDYKVAGQQSPVQSCPTCKPPAQQIIYTPLIESKESSYAEINLNCRSSHAIDVVPTFYTAEGMPVIGETIHLLPAEMRFVDVRSLIPTEHRGKHGWGGMTLSYTGNTMEVWAQMTFHGITKNGSVNSLFAVVDARRSNVREAVWRMPKNATATLALGNYSDTPAAATLTFSNGDVEQINLAPYATEILQRKSNGQNGTNIGAESVTINSSGQTGRLITTGFVSIENGDFGSSIRFADPENIAQPNLYATNFRLKDTAAHIVLKNTTTSPITARPRFLPMAGEGSGVVELPVVTIQPNAIKEVNLTTLMNAARTRTDLDSVGVQIINGGAAGSLIGAANFTNNITGIDYDIPLRDSGTAQNSAGGYPIRLDDDYTTNLSITNVGDKAGQFTLQVNFDGGLYAMYPRELAPGETAAFDFRKIRDQQIPDSSGKVLPLNLTVAQIRWSMIGRAQTRMIGRSEIISKSGKVSSSYSCGVCCRNSYYSSRLTPDEVFAFVGDDTQFTAKETDTDCYGGQFYEYTVIYQTWSSSDTSVADFYNVNGLVSAFDVGDVQISATWDANYSIDNGSDGCMDFPMTPAPVAYMAIGPRITSIAPSRGGVGSTTRVTINGSGFRPNVTTVNAGSGISVSIVSVASTRIIADFAIAANATGGDRSVIVTVAGKPSKPVKFFVQIPTSLSVLSVTLIPTLTVTDLLSSSCNQGVDYGISVAIKYQVNDQSNPASPIKNNIMVAQETVTNRVINGGQPYDPFPTYDDLGPSNVTGTSRTTDANGQFLDAPFGLCGNGPFTISETQDIRMLIDSTQISYHVRTNNFVIASTTDGQGSITNNSDIQKSRP